MSELGIRFRVVPSRIDEGRVKAERPSALVKRRALAKARDVLRRVGPATVLGLDTVVVLRGRVLGKPRSRGEAVRMLGEESGRWQRVYTGAAVLCGKARATGYAVSRVRMRRLSREEIRRMAGRHLDKAGAYAVQDQAGRVVDRIQGGVDTVIGFPKNLVLRLLRQAGGRRSV